MNKDPDYQQIIEAIEPFVKSNQIDDFDIAKGVHYFACNFHTGQSSNLYAVCSTGGFKPGIQDTLSDGSRLVYNELVRQFHGIDQPMLASWNAEQRSARALAALHAYTAAKGEVVEETDIQNLLTDMLHLMRLAGRTQDDMGAMLRMAVENFTEEVAEEDDVIEPIDATIPPDGMDMDELMHVGEILSPDLVPVREKAWIVGNEKGHGGIPEAL